MGLAGLWDEWKNRETGERIESCTMIITEPNLRAPASGIRNSEFRLFVLQTVYFGRADRVVRRPSGARAQSFPTKPIAEMDEWRRSFRESCIMAR
jgi:hypothetical protein